MNMILRFKLSILFLLCVWGLQAQHEDVLMTVGNADVTTSEFKYIYEKNNGTNADYSKKSLDEYLDLYKRFKLKVQKAKAMKLDTVPDLMRELDGYRKQLAASYLIDKEVTDQLIKELYERTKYDVKFSHIFVSAAENATEDVKKAAWQKIENFKKELKNGASFEELAKQSDDHSSSGKGGDMGYFTAKLPSGFYDLENALYNTEVGKISDIIKTKIGYHIIKVTDKRPARGMISVSHIMLTQGNKELADSLVFALRNGADFVELAKKYSIDKTSNKNGGKLATFGINSYDKAFEDASFALEKDGDISVPVFTRAGWHIIKRDNKVQRDSYETFLKKMKGQINTDSRFDKAKDALVEKIKSSTKFEEHPDVLESFTQKLNDDFNTYKWIPELSNPSATLVTIGDMAYSISDFADYTKKNTKIRLKYDVSKPKGEVVDELYKAYTTDKVLEFEEKSLPQKYPDFKALMREYEEGILLFEATRINVWDKANQDTVGLEKFYEMNKANYHWDEQANVLHYSIHTSDKSLAEKISDFASKKDWEKVNAKFNKKENVVTITESQFDKSSKQFENLPFALHAKTDMKYDDQLKAFTFDKVEKIVPQRQKSLAEARGYVVADYQDYLEKKWVAELEKEFPVHVHKEVLDKLTK